MYYFYEVQQGRGGGGTVTDDDDLHVQNLSENSQGIVFAEIFVFQVKKIIFNKTVQKLGT